MDCVADKLPDYILAVDEQAKLESLLGIFFLIWEITKITFCRFSLVLQGAVSGVLLVTPNNIMFDPHRMDPLVQAHGCEEYGIMCPVEEVQSAAVCKEITDPKIREAVPE